MMNSFCIEEIKKIANLPYQWNIFNDKTILMSGGTGLIGSLFCDVVAYRNEKFSANIKIISLSRKDRADTETIKFLKQDVVTPFSVTEPIDFVLHLASNTHPMQYEEDPIGTIITNVYGCNNLLKIAAEKKAKFLLASSVEIYGQGSKLAMKENYCGYLDCNSARAGYNESKRVCESLLQSYRSQKGVTALTIRLSRVFGVDKKQDTKAINQFIEKAIAGEDIVLKSKGEQRFSYIYVADAVSAIFFLLLKGANGESYNVAADDDGSTLGEYADFIASLAGKKVVYDIENNEFTSKATTALMDTNKIKKLGWYPMYSVKEGLKRTFEIKLKTYNG